MLGSDHEIKKVKEYLKIGEFIYTTPKEREEFFMVPYSYYGDNSTPFIEVYCDGVLSRTVNYSSLSEVRYYY